MCAVHESIRAYNYEHVDVAFFRRMTDVSADVQRGAAGSFLRTARYFRINLATAPPRACRGARREEYSFRRVVRGAKKKGGQENAGVREGCRSARVYKL